MLHNSPTLICMSMVNSSVPTTWNSRIMEFHASRNVNEKKSNLHTLLCFPHSNMCELLYSLHYNGETYHKRFHYLSELVHVCTHFSFKGEPSNGVCLSRWEAFIVRWICTKGVDKPHNVTEIIKNNHETFILNMNLIFSRNYYLPKCP